MFVVGLAACAGGGNEPPAVAVPRTSPTAQPVPAPVELRFGGFSSMREALQTRLLPMFARSWNRKQTPPVDIRTRFAGSEALLEALRSDFPADVAVLSSPRDLEDLIASGLCVARAPGLPHGGIVCRSLVVLAVRKGNPLQVRDWTDLTRAGLRLVAPDPKTSGGGAWNVCAMFGAALRGHAGVPAGDVDAARDFVARVEANVVARGANAHESFHAFLEGVGDVAISYESELAQAWLFGHDIERVLPTSTVLVECPAVLIDRNVDARGTRPMAQALLDHLWSREAQRVLATCGLRPVDEAVAVGRSEQLPLPQDLWTVDQLGGWPRIEEQLRSWLEPPAAPAASGR